MRSRSILLAFIFLLSFRVQADLTIENAWVKNAPPVVPARAAYLTFVNNGTSEIAIKKVSSPLFSSASIHETKKTNGVYTMSELDHLVIPAHARIELRPMGKHIMLMMPKKPLQGIKQIKINIDTSDSKSHTLMFPVKDSM